MKEKIEQAINNSSINFKIRKQYKSLFIRILNKNFNKINFDKFINEFLNKNKLKFLNDLFLKKITIWSRDNCKDKHIENFISAFISKISKDKLKKLFEYNFRLDIDDFHILNKLFCFLFKDKNIKYLFVLRRFTYSYQNIINVAKFNKIEIDKDFLEISLQYFASDYMLYSKEYRSVYIENFQNLNIKEMPEISFSPSTKIKIIKEFFPLWEKYFSRELFLERMLDFYLKSKQHLHRILHIIKELGINPKEVLLIKNNRRSSSINQFIKDLSEIDEKFAGYLYFD